MTYRTPIKDMAFSLYHAAQFDRIQKTEQHSEVTPDLVGAIIEEAGKFCDTVIAPLNQGSDEAGAALNRTHVTTPAGFIEAYQSYVEAEWNGLAFSPEYDGQGLPGTLSVAVTEAMNASCMSLAIGAVLTMGAAKAVSKVGTSDQKDRYLKKMVSGAWTGAMGLTEPQSGSDLSGIRTKAARRSDGRFSLTGQKIFITYGEHDLTDNIVHLVLARLPDAPPGTAGISMFLVPKYLVNSNGTIGARNGIECIGLEHKLGLHGSPTATLAMGESGECIGEILGEENRGLQNMFVMMNSARLDVGAQSVGVSERAYQHALHYAFDRRQGALAGADSKEPTPIVNHPDVVRMLLTMKSLTEASRAICYANAVAQDLAQCASEPADRKAAKAREELLTPISKAWSSDRANEITSIGVQIFGGMGFVEETGAAQHMRDVRISAIYEGTNGIQAIDLVGRKLQRDSGEAARAFTRDVKTLCETLIQHDSADLRSIGSSLRSAATALETSIDWIIATGRSDKNKVLSSASIFLKQFGNVAGGFYLARGAVAAVGLLNDQNEDADYLNSKILNARFFADHYLPQSVAMTQSIIDPCFSEVSLKLEVATA